MKKITLFLFILSICIIYGTPLQVTSSNSDLTISGSYELTNLKKRIVQENEFIQIESSDFAVTGKLGEAELPAFSQLVSLPNNGNYILKDFKYDYEEISLNKKIVPFGWEDNISINQDYYVKNEWFPQELVIISKPNIMRGIRFSQIAISMVQYNPARNKIRILKDIDANFSFDHSITENSLTLDRNNSSKSFSQIAEKNIFGYQKKRSEEDGSYLFICSEGYDSNLQPLLRHKEKLGFRTKVATLSETGSSNNEIKSYLQNAYDNWEYPPEYVILIGDVSGNIIVPTFYVEGGYLPWAATDHTYTLLEGDDYFPDIMIGRISVQITMQLVTIVNKIINYESNPFQGDWITKALAISFKENNSYNMDSPRETKIAVREKLLNFTYTVVDTFFHPYQTGQSQLENVINTGYTFINFRGSGNPDHWSSHSGYNFFEIDNINNLNNGYMLPFITSMTCCTGDFGDYEFPSGFGETWLIAGSPSTPKGAIGLIGPSEWDTEAPWNNANDIGIYQGITQENLFKGGEMLLRGKMALYNNYPNCHDWGDPSNSDQFYFFVYNLLGDPGLAVWTDTPQEISLNIDNQMIVGENFIEIEIDCEDLDKSGFKIAVTNLESLIATGITDENGKVNIPVDLPAGNYEVTASKYGFIPITDSLNVAASDILCLSEYSFSDDLISGKTINLETTISNNGNNNAENIEIELISNNQYLQVNSEILSVNQISSQSTYQANFQFQLGDDWNNDLILELFLNITSNYGESNFIILVEINSPELIVSEFIVDNSTNCLIPNTTQNINIEFLNCSDISTDEFSVNLISLNEKTDIILSESNYDNILGNSTGINSSSFQISVANVISGELAKFNMQISKNETILQEIIFTIPIGVIDEFSPTFCEYGYYAIESRDVGNFDAPEYNWIEIDPQYDGIGDSLKVDYSQIDGYIGIIDLPFDFQYFVGNYDRISVCSNGYITMGESSLIFFRNRNIPSGVGTPAMIAPFWDNLENGSIYTLYDSENHCFIIEWSEFRNVYDPASIETFQVILYDPEFHQTPTNDGKILFQYKDIHNVDQDDQYATVGIENKFQNDGILITFANIYPATTQPLQSETAILFTIKENFNFPLLSVESNSIDITLPMNSSTTKNLMLQNICSGDIDLSYTIEFSHFRKGKEADKSIGRNIENDQIWLSTSQYVTTVPINIMFYFIHSSPDEEPVEGIKLDFPEGFVINEAIDIGSLGWNGETGDGVEVSWGFGNGESIAPATPQSFRVSVTIDENCIQPADIAWFIQGDGSGEEPHSISGIETIVPSDESFIWVSYPEENQVMIYGLQDSVKWNSYGDMDEVNILLETDNTADWQPLASNVENSGFYEFTVPGPLSENCRIKICSLDEEVFDISPFFRITALNIIYPVGNTIMTYATQDSLKWIDTGGLEVVDIYFSRDNGKNWEMIAEDYENTGFYSFEVTGPPSSRCRFKISSSDDLIYNVSPNSFEITDSPVDWLSFDSYSGIIESNEIEEISLTVNTNDLPIGNYSAFIKISTDFGQVITIPINLNTVDEYYNNSRINNNYPNPFNVSTKISFSLPKNTTKAQINIYNIKGQRIKTLEFSPTAFEISYEVTWDGKDENNKKVGSGIYFYNLKVGSKDIGTKKCLLVK